MFQVQGNRAYRKLLPKFSTGQPAKPTPSRSYNINMESTGQEEKRTLPEPQETSYEYTQQQEDFYPLEFDQEQKPNDI
jgi:hypothetical protein